MNLIVAQYYKVPDCKQIFVRGKVVLGVKNSCFAKEKSPCKGFAAVRGV